ATWSAPNTVGFAGRSELLHPAVAVFHDVKARVRPGAEGEIVRIGELPRFRPELAEGANELAIAGKHLNPMIAGIGGVKQTIRSQGHGADARELAGLGSRAAPALHEGAVRVELGDALIGAEFSDVKKAIAVLEGVADVGKLP